MKIKCKQCGRTEITDKDFFVKLVGGAMPVGGFWAWTTYLFAGTGFAMAIVFAIIGGGVAMLLYRDEIVEWIINQDYKCQVCGSVKWTPCGENGVKPSVAVKKITPCSPEESIIVKPVVETTTNIYGLLVHKRKSDESMVMCVDDNHTVLNSTFVLEASSYKVEKTFTGWKIKNPSGDLILIGSVDELAMFADECIQLIVEDQRKNAKHYSSAVIFSILSISQSKLGSG
jgi:hypothetical protein